MCVMDTVLNVCVCVRLGYVCNGHSTECVC